MCVVFNQQNLWTLLRDRLIAFNQIYPKIFYRSACQVGELVVRFSQPAESHEWPKHKFEFGKSSLPEARLANKCVQGKETEMDHGYHESIITAKQKVYEDHGIYLPDSKVVDIRTASDWHSKMTSTSELNHRKLESTTCRALIWIYSTPLSFRFNVVSCAK